MSTNATDGTFDHIEGILLEAIVAQRTDPITRFIESLPKGNGPLSGRSFAEEAVKLRSEFEHHIRSMLLAEPREAMAHARWIAENAERVAYAWSSLISCVKRFNQIDTSLFVHVAEKGSIR